MSKALQELQGLQASNDTQPTTQHDHVAKHRSWRSLDWTASCLGLRRRPGWLHSTDEDEQQDNSTSADPNGVPTRTKSYTESSILKALKACNARNFETIADVALQGVEGEPIDDKTYLMEHIIQLAADLPLDGRLSDTLTNNFLNQLWNDLDHPPKSYLGYDYVFRKPDGSNNNILWPNIGKSMQPYARSVRPQKMQPPRPDPGVIFDSVLVRDKDKFEPHPNKISSVLFYLASIIIHDCFHTSHDNYAISETSSYLDLAPLYGSNEQQQMAMRTGKDGKIFPDCFSDNRLLDLPPGVGVLLIMFNRFHNDVVENLAKIDEDNRFSNIKTSRNAADRGKLGMTKVMTGDVNRSDRTADQDYDEALFQTARLITTGLYVNIILQDYVRTILGLNRVDSLWNLDPRSDYGKAILGHKIPDAQGNQVSAEFSLVYRWHSCVSQRDEKWATERLKPFGNLGEIFTASDKRGQLDPPKRPFDILTRNEEGYFKEEDLLKIWVEGVEDVAGAFGPHHVPAVLKPVEILGIQQARAWNLASLNEFRQYFKLKPHKKFEDINSDPYVAQQLERLYGHPDNVELYPGVVVESTKKPMAPGSGLCGNFTTTRAILADAVSLVRSDRFHTIDYTPRNLTNWGFQTASYDQDIDHGGVFYKLVLNAFHSVDKNSVYAHFPLVNPPENKVILRDLKRDQLYSFVKPEAKQRPHIKLEPSFGVESKFLTHGGHFASLWSQRAASYGAPEVVKPSAHSKMSFAEVIMIGSNWKARAVKYYTEALQKLWYEKQYELGGQQQVDIVGDVLNPAHLGFITSVLGIPLEGTADAPQSLLNIFGNIFHGAFNPNPQPHSLHSAIRSNIHRMANGIESKLRSEPNGAAKWEELDQTAFAKMIEATGTTAKQTIWYDVLPTSALLLRTISCLTAEFVDTVLLYDGGCPSRLAPISIAKQSGTPVDNAQKGQPAVVNVTDADIEDHSLDLALAVQLSYICIRAMTDIFDNISKSSRIKRTPGPLGQIKRVTGEYGEAKYLNKLQSEYVAFPIGLTVYWEKTKQL